MANWNTIKRDWQREELSVSKELYPTLQEQLGPECLRGGGIMDAKAIWYLDAVRDDTGEVFVDTAIVLQVLCSGDFGFDNVPEDEELEPHWIEFKSEGPAYTGTAEEWEETLYAHGEPWARAIVNNQEDSYSIVDSMFYECP